MGIFAFSLTVTAACEASTGSRDSMVSRVGSDSRDEAGSPSIPGAAMAKHATARQATAPLPQRLAQAEAPGATETDPLDAEFDWEPEDVGFPDPLEEVNRGVLHANRALDRWLFEPMTDVYRFLVPGPGRDAIRRAFLNVGSVSVLANDLLQLEAACARDTFLRLVLNTTFGVGGLFDPAAKAGLKRHGADFGQTLARYGVGSGPYIMLPLLGPNTTRDAFGTFVDTLLQPAFYLLAPVQRLTVGGSFGLSSRDVHGQALTALEESSLDFYAALRNAYYQARIAEIEAERDCPCEPEDGLPRISTAPSRSSVGEVAASVGD